MPLESATYIDGLNPSNPVGSDPVAFTDEHLRLIKSVLQSTFPNIAGAVTASHTDLNHTVAYQVPVGGIILWSGLHTAVPAGWQLCDGTGGTPDLRSRFVIGAGSTYASRDTGGTADAVVVAHTHTAATGNGSADHTHTVTGTTNSVADHRHFTMLDADGHNYNGAGAGDTVTNANHADAGNWQYETASGNTADANVGRTNAAGGHNHTINLTESPSGSLHTHAVTVDSAGIAGTNLNLPPFLALAYIMKL